MSFNTIKVNSTDTGYVHSIFDISEYNSGAIYADLTAALAAVPQDKKHGGMTVKFIQQIPARYSVVKTDNLTTEPTGTLLSGAPPIDSGTYDESRLTGVFTTLPSSTGAGNALTYYVAVTVDETTTYTSWVITKVQNSDNRYVQYRLMADSFNITVANWQGVDDEPTAESDNLVKSGGVYQILYGEVEEIIPTYYQIGYFILNDGTTGASAPYGITNPIQLQRGQTIKVNAMCVAHGVQIALTDSNSSFYTKLKNGLGTKGEVSYTATEDCYVASSYNRNEGATIKIVSNNGIENEIRYLEEKITQERQRAESSYNDLELSDSTGSSVQSNQLLISLNKNDGSEENPVIRNLTNLTLYAATKNKAGLLSAGDKDLLIDALGTKEFVTPTYYQTGYFILTDGTTGASAPYGITNPIQLQRGQTIKVNAMCVAHGSQIALTDANSSFYRNLAAGLGTKGEVSYTATEDCYVASSYNRNEGAMIKIIIDGSYEHLKTTVDGTTQIITPSTAESGKFLIVNSDGSCSPAASGPYVIINPIPLKKGEIISITANCASHGSQLALTDANSSFYKNIAFGSGEVATVSYIAVEDCYVSSSYMGSSQIVVSNPGVDDIVKKVVDLEYGIITNINPTYYQIGYFILNDGTTGASAPYGITNPIQLLKGQTIKVNAMCVAHGVQIALTDANSSFYTKLKNGLGTKGEVSYTATEDCYVASSYNRSDGVTIKIYIYSGVIDLNKKIAELKKDTEDSLSEMSVKLAKASANNIITTFDHIVSVGDSLTFSQVYTSDSASRQAYNPWPKCVKKICGLDSYNIFAVGGATSKSIWNTYKDSFAVPSQGKTLVTIYLGTNNWFEDTIDTSAPAADVENYRTAWTNDYTGCMCKIIQTFINLGAKIVLIRPWVGGVYPQNEVPEGWTLSDTNEVIRKIALRFNIPYIDSSSINSRESKYHLWPDLQGSNVIHYNDLGYAYFADAFIKEIGNMKGDFVKLLIPD